MKKSLCMAAAAILSLSACGKPAEINNKAPSQSSSVTAVIQEAQKEYENNQADAVTQDEDLNETPSAESVPVIEENAAEENTNDVSQGEYDVDLTVLSSTMVYSEVYNMMVYPENYLGKTVKMSGYFMVYEGEKRNYYACVIQDATACCSQGIEFILADNLIYPEDYPEPGTIITVSGIFDVYSEDNLEYCQLIEAEFTD